MSFKPLIFLAACFLLAGCTTDVYPTRDGGARVQSYPYGGYPEHHGHGHGRKHGHHRGHGGHCPYGQWKKGHCY